MNAQRRNAGHPTIRTLVLCISAAGGLAVQSLAFSPAGASSPVVVSFSSGPASPTAAAAASFTFSANEAGTNYVCSLDGWQAQPCWSGMSYGPVGGEAALISRAVRYGTAPDGTELLLDEYLPGSEGPWPAVLVVHGGGWRGGNRAVIAPEAQAFAAAGFAAYAVDFRHAPGRTGNDPWPAQIEDLQSAMRYVRSLSYVVGVGVFGKSSGGHLAQYMGTTGIVGDTRPDAIASFSGPSKLEILNPGNPAYEIAVTNLIGCPVSGCLPRWRDVSPFFNVTSTSSPMYIALSSDDPLVYVDHIREMDAQLSAFGVEHVAREIPGSGHTKAVQPLVWADMLDFLVGRLAPEGDWNLILPQGEHTFSVYPMVSGGGVGQPSSWTWIIDRTPPEVTFTAGPEDTTMSTSATFLFVANESVLTFTCLLDRHPATTCASGVSYPPLARGRHILFVQATDAAGNVGPSEKWSWVIARKTPRP